jgi:hypothetical protein
MLPRVTTDGTRPAAAAAALALLAGCAQMSSDVNDVTGSIFPPTPTEAARWAVDNTNPEAQRKGVMLLGTASFGGDPVYVELYKTYIELNTDPLVKAAAVQALARHGRPDDAPLIARQLDSPFTQVRLAAARGLQRVHNPAVADLMWKQLVNPDEDADVRVELAIALGQYPRDDVFQALCTALDQRELAVNLAAADSLRLLTTEDFGLDRRMWLGWYRTRTSPFRRDVPYYFPTYQRALGLGDYLMFWAIPTFEEPGVPAGLMVAQASPPVPPAPAGAARPSAPPVPAGTPQHPRPPVPTSETTTTPPAP